MTRENHVSSTSSGMKAGIITIAAIVLVILATVVVTQSVYAVDETQQVVILQFGRYIRTDDTPGLHVKMPFVQSAVRFEKRVLTSDTTPSEYLTLDKKRLSVDHVTRWRITDPLQFYKSVRNEAGASSRIYPIVFSEMRDELAKHNFDDIIAGQRDTIMANVATRSREKVIEYGVELVDVRIKRADLPAEVQTSVFDRMKAERDRIAKQYRAEGEEQALETRATADKEKTIILAEAYEQGETLRGEGDAGATAIYAAAYGQDEDFYRFLRTLEAYEKFLAGSGTTLVLESDSDLLEFLGTPTP